MRVSSGCMRLMYAIFVAKNQFVTMHWHPAIVVAVQWRRHHSHCAVDASVAVLVLNSGSAVPNGLHQPHAVFDEVADAANDAL